MERAPRISRRSFLKAGMAFWLTALTVKTGLQTACKSEAPSSTPENFPQSLQAVSGQEFALCVEKKPTILLNIYTNKPISGTSESYLQSLAKLRQAEGGSFRYLVIGLRSQEAEKDTDRVLSLMAKSGLGSLEEASDHLAIVKNLGGIYLDDPANPSIHSCQIDQKTKRPIVSREISGLAPTVDELKEVIKALSQNQP